MSNSYRDSTVIDFAAYRAARETSAHTADTCTPLTGDSRRGGLSARALAHRARMLVHLRGTRDERDRQAARRSS
jgi:hypothetical protein